MNLTVVLDTPLWPLCTARIPSSPAGTSKPPAVPAGVIVPSLSVLAAERQVTGAGRHAASLRFAENVPFTAGHAVDAMDWRAVDWPVAHAVAIAWHAVKAGDPVTVPFLEPELYAGTGITPLNPT
ncbi:hypothetical protein OOK13_29295 [Streptomyces sp. NBC_00378]|uniref:hypothetical protein n=1 Tax=unclassified Streptomyces TaxID=2593676 RepID=UPI0022541A7F|nr:MULTISPECIES: hypothetical protein [unclassified Streptomyces]MCX5112500.1 hypothetical protein [Streptomyces sp. NBC_00378]